MKSSPVEKRFSRHTSYARIDHATMSFHSFFLLNKKRKREEKGKNTRFIGSKFRNSRMRFDGEDKIIGSGRCAEADAANASPPLANLDSPRLENRTRAIPAMISLRGTGLKACSQSRAHPPSNTRSFQSVSGVSLSFPAGRREEGKNIFSSKFINSNNNNGNNTF